MNRSNLCQSCSMPMETDNLRGTEADASLSKEYCIYCYENGEYTRPEINMDEMKLLVKTRINAMRIPSELRLELIKLSEKLIPEMHRWSTKEVFK